MRKLPIAALLVTSMAAPAFAQVLDCAKSTTVHYKIIFTRTWGINDCDHGLTFAQTAAEGKNPPGMTCEAPIKQGQAWERNCSGSGMKLHILYANK